MRDKIVVVDDDIMSLKVVNRIFDKAGMEGVYDVTDTGIGIREENIPYLFDAFQRMDEEHTHAIEGTGLGLSIVKQLLDLMEGSVTVTSEYGKGSSFRIFIPQEIVDGTPVGEVDLKKGDPRTAASYASTISVSDAKILVVGESYELRR